MAENPATSGICRVLVVRGQLAPGQSVGEILKGAGHLVTETFELSDVTAELENDEFGLLVLDLSPPDTAIELLDQIVGLPPVLVVSDTSEFSLADLRISAFLRRPFAPNVLLEMVSRIARNHRPGNPLFLG